MGQYRRKLGRDTLERDAGRLRTVVGSSSGGAGTAPNDAKYLTLATDTDLTQERVFTDGDGLVGTDGGGGSAYTLDVDLVAAWSGLEFSGGELRVNEDAAFVWTALHSFAAGVTLNGASSANIITIPDNVAQAANLVDAGGLEYLRIVSTNAQPVIDFNSAAADIDFHVGASGVADAFQVQGSNGQITLGALGAGFVQSSGGGVLSSAAIVPGDLPAHTHAGAGEGGPLVIGTTDTGATAGSILFAGAAGVQQQDNTNLFWDDGANELGVGINTPDGTIHAHTATAGAVTPPVFADDLVVENSGDGGISILTPAANTGSLLFGSPVSNVAGGFSYNHGADQLSFIVGGAAPQFYIDPTGLYASGPIIMSDDNYVGFGAAAGRIEFDDQATDEINFLDCVVGIGTSDPDEDLHVLSSAAGDGPTILVENTNAGISPPTFDFYKNSVSPADGDYLGAWDFYGNTSTGAQERYAYFFVKSLDVTNGDTGGGMDFRVVMDSTERSMLEIEGYNGSVNEGKITINKDGQDVDFKVEASGVADALEVQGSDGEITLGALGAGFVQSTAGGILSSAAIIAADLPAHDHSGAGEGGSLVVGTTDTDATAGSIFFAGAAGVIQEDNAGLFYDDTNNTLGIRSNIPHTLADALYVPWITGDTQTTATFGSSNAANDQIAIGVTSYSDASIVAQAQDASCIFGETNSSTATDFGVLGWATGAGGGVSAKSATGTALYVNITGAGTIANFEDGGATVWSILDGGALLCGATGTLDLNGVADALILDANANTTISAPTDDQIDFEIGGADDFTMTANSFNVLSGSNISMADGSAIGITGNELLTFNAAGTIAVSGANFGIGQATPGTLLEVGDGTGSPHITINKDGAGTGRIMFDRGVNNDWYIEHNTAEGLEIVGVKEDENFIVKVNDGGVTRTALIVDASAAEFEIWPDGDGELGIGTAAPGSITEWGLATENLEIVDAGSAGATEQDWIEVQVGGATGYIRVFAAV